MPIDFGALATAIATIATGAFAFVKWYLPHRREKKTNANTIQGLQSISRVYDTMREMEHSSIDRIILFAGHNGGGIPTASKPFYVTALHWIADVASSKIIEDYVNIRVDSDYVAMLLSAREKGWLSLDVSTMPDCKLKQYYLLEGVTHSLIVFLAVKDKKFFYFSAATSAPGGIDANTRNMVLLKSEKIINELNKKPRE